MKRLALALVLSMVPAAARADCSSEDRAELAQMGYTTEQIDAQCGSGQNAFAPPTGQAASYCQTAYGYCALPSLAAAGDSCMCESQYGPIPGVAQ